MSDLKNRQRRKAYGSQLVEQAVMDDVAMDVVITEKTIYAGKGRQFFN
jgi:5-formyltetrahydrofolate cyclo-ligase